MGARLTEGEIPAYVVQGDPLSARSAPTELGIRVAEHRGFGGEATPERLLSDAARFADVYSDDAVRRGHLRLIKHVRRELLDRQLAVHRAGPSLAKVLSAGIFAA